MANEYTFHCPIKKEGTTVSHCEQVHKNGTQGRPERTEDKICALAHACFMCPFRNAVRVGGIWSKAENIPKADKPQEKPTKLPPQLVGYALAHTPPNRMDYRRVGLWGDDVGIHDELFRSFESMGHAFNRSSVVSQGSGASKPEPKEPAKKSLADIATDVNENEMADAVTELARAERKQASQKRKSVNKQSAQQKTKDRAEKRSHSVSDDAKPRMSLAERAKMMKQKKEAAE